MVSTISFIQFALQFDDGKVSFDGELSADGIKNFVRAESIPLVTEFSDEVNAICYKQILLFLRLWPKPADAHAFQSFSNSKPSSPCVATFAWPKTIYLGLTSNLCHISSISLKGSSDPGNNKNPLSSIVPPMFTVPSA